MAQNARKTKSSKTKKSKLGKPNVLKKKTKLPTRTQKKKTTPKKVARKATIKRKLTPAKKALVTKIRTVKASKVSATPVSRIGVGDWAPNFTLQDTEGRPVTLIACRGKKVVLYFYPKDDTPGCTKEACNFRDQIADFTAQDALVLGISFDDQTSHQKFTEKYGLNFPLLSDLDKKVATDYGVYVEKNMYGNRVWGIERSTFVIDREGKIVAAFRKVSVDGHNAEILQALQAIA